MDTSLASAPSSTIPLSHDYVDHNPQCCGRWGEFRGRREDPQHPPWGSRKSMRVNSISEPREASSGLPKGPFQPAKTGLDPHRTGLDPHKTGLGAGILKHASALGGDAARVFGKVAGFSVFVHLSLF